jgi:polysaccharide biosynthesis protein PslL
MRTRLLLLDNAKALGIVLVVLGHSWLMQEPLRDVNVVLGSFRLPFFFFISGAIFPVSRGVRNIAWQRADAWLKPFFVVVVAMGLWHAIRGAGSLEKTLVQLAFGTGFTLEWGPMWFLPHLWLLCVLSAAFLNGPGRLLRTSPSKVLFLLILGLLGYTVLHKFGNGRHVSVCSDIGKFEPVLWRWVYHSALISRY